MNGKICCMFVLILFLLTSCDNSIHYIDNLEKDIITNDEIHYSFEYTESNDTHVSYNAINGTDFLQYNEGYIYFYNGYPTIFGNRSSTLWKYNIQTGNLKTVCDDPLCTHNDPHCPIFGITPAFYIYNNNIFYRRSYRYVNGNKTEDYSGFMAYNMETSKIIVYNKYDELLGPLYGKQLYVDNYRFYYEYSYDEESKTSYAMICRMNIDTKEIVTLKENNEEYENATSSFSLGTMFLFSLNNRIYFSDGTCIFSTDYNMENRITHIYGTFVYRDIYTDGEYIYYGVSDNYDDITVQTLYQIKLDGSDKKNLGVKTKTWRLTNNYIYYGALNQDIVEKNGLSGYSGENVTLSLNEIRRCFHDGTNDTQIFKFSNENINSEFLTYFCVGNYIYGLYVNYTDNNNNGIIEDDEVYNSISSETYNILRVNMITGEYYYIRP